MDASELTPSEWVHIIAYGALALYVATALPGLFRGRFLTGVATLAAWVAIFLAVLTGYAYRVELGTVAERVLAVLIPGTVVETGPREVTVFRQPDGQFMVNAAIGASRVALVVDTGASSVVLRQEDAARLRIPVARLTYDVEVATANGRTLAAETMLPSLSIGPLVQRQVKALVARPGALHENLLGMSFLGDLESFTISNDKLVLRGR